MKHMISLQEWTPAELTELLDLAGMLKAHPEHYRQAAYQKVLLMIFEKPSLRTRVSFETGMVHMGGHAIFYDMSTSPLGAGKESVHDTIKTVSRYVDLVVARLFEHSSLIEMAKFSSVPIINGLTNFSHPCQILADLVTIKERFGSFEGLKLCYLGDSHNNVTHSLMIGCAMMGLDITVGCPNDPEFEPLPEVLKEAKALAAISGATVEVMSDPHAAAKGAHAVYTDTWMSYHIPAEEMERRIHTLQPFQVDSSVMAEANKEAVFMNCLPARRGFEQSAEVIDGPQSIVFDQAENRMHAQNAVMISLLNAAES